jgi:phage N-6-adenine-methyltransferase
MTLRQQGTVFSAQTCMWSTPQYLFDQLDKEFAFELDVCASPENAKCTDYWTAEDDGLLMPWKSSNWCNPPYGNRISDWLAKAAIEAEKGNTTVFLIPSRTDTRWFHEYCLGYAKEIRFIKGRLKFGDAEHSAPFPSMLVIFKH